VGKLTHITVRIPAKLKKAVEKHVENSNYANISEFVREALREKLRREAA